MYGNVGIYSVKHAHLVPRVKLLVHINMYVTRDKICIHIYYLFVSSEDYGRV